MSPLNALAGQHQEEDGNNEQGSTSLPPEQHGWTDGATLQLAASYSAWNLSMLVWGHRGLLLPSSVHS